MAKVLRHTDTDPGWINRRLRDLERQIRELRAEKRLAGSSFAQLPAGAIPQSAVGNPSNPGFVSGTASGFAVPTGGAEVIRRSATVPPGFTSCVVQLTGRVLAVNSTAGNDYLYARVSALDVLGNALPVPVPAVPAWNNMAMNVATMTAVLTGLTPGSDVVLKLRTWTAGADWAADARSTADLSGGVTWFN